MDKLTMKCSRKCVYWAKDANLCIRSMECPEPPIAGKECPYGVQRDARITDPKIAHCIKPGPAYATIYARLYRYEQAKDEGCLIKLPCPVGTTIYSVFKRKNFYVKKSTLTFYNMERILKEFGKTVFTDEKEANKVCDELNNVISQPDCWYEIRDNVMYVMDGNAIIAEISDCSEEMVYRVLGWVIEHKQALKDIENHFGEEIVFIKFLDILGWLYEHEQLWEDFINHSFEFYTIAKWFVTEKCLDEWEEE